MRVRRALNQAVAFHARQQLRHRRLLHVEQPGQLLLRQRTKILKRSKNRYLRRCQAQPLQTWFHPPQAQPGSAVDQVTRIRKNFRIHVFS